MITTNVNPIMEPITVIMIHLLYLFINKSISHKSKE